MKDFFMHTLILKKEIKLEKDIKPKELKKCNDNFINYTLKMRVYIKLEGNKELGKRKLEIGDDKFISYTLKMIERYKELENEKSM